jgi:3-deoxy-D-manno-octulosonate 8-phosphate phosphatase (KDO 8-P phosphatase)
MGEAGIGSERARRVRLVVLDVDGVLTDNGVYIGRTVSGEAVELKRFHIMDGLGMKMLQWAGLTVVLVSGRESAATSARAEELGVECRQVAAGYKIPVVEELLEDHGVEWDQVAMLADDLADLPVLERVGLPVAVANAAPEVRAEAAWVTHRPGGEGAVREFAEALLSARGEWARLVAAYRRSRVEGGEVADFLEPA